MSLQKLLIVTILCIAENLFADDIALITPNLVEVHKTVQLIKGENLSLDNQITQITNKANYLLHVNGKPAPIKSISFKRRPSSVANTGWNLQAGMWAYLTTETVIPENARLTAEVNIPDFWEEAYTGQVSRLRTNTIFHVSQAGYQQNLPKQAYLGLFLGTEGELPLTALPFSLINSNETEVFIGKTQPRPDKGFPYSVYQQVYSINFDSFNKPGIYRIFIPGYGTSQPFRIGEEPFSLLTRLYEQGFYNQRCGTAIVLPYTRFEHASCHCTPAAIPNSNMEGLTTMNSILAGFSAGFKGAGVYPITNLSTLLFPYVNQGTVDVHGGHHDAGDYSRYMVNMTKLSELLLFAVEVFPGADKLDNLGIPESGDGIPDILQEAKWEIDAVARMQDSDGGFYSIIYPRNRKYEDFCLPEEGDTQVVFPKEIVSSEMGTALMAEAASSPEMQRYFPKDAATYRIQALKGSKFVEDAFSKYGTNAYTPLGFDYYQWKDSLAWMYCEMFLLTTNQNYNTLLEKTYQPNSVDTAHWGWMHMDQGWGNAAREYIFAAETKRVPTNVLDLTYLAQCRKEAIDWASTLAEYSAQCAYGTSLPIPSKRQTAAGWYFSEDNAYDLAVGICAGGTNLWQAFTANMYYVTGANPLNQPCVTGLGSPRYVNKLNQFSQARKLEMNFGTEMLPPSGLPDGNLSARYPYYPNYGSAVGHTTFPYMLPNTTGTPLYDRNCDQPSSLCEQVGPDLARALGASAFIMAKTKYATQPWHTNSARIKILETNKEYVCSLETPLDLTEASFCWESMGSHYDLAKTHVHRVTRTGDQWVQVEAWLPDGQHIAASTSFKATITNPDLPTITIIAEKPTASLKKGDNGRVRITRSNTNGTLTVQGQFSGALNNGDMGWLPGSNYSASSTTWEFSDGQASLIIPIIAKQPAGDHRTKLLHITLQPSAGYNVAYPATAIIKINH